MHLIFYGMIRLLVVLHIGHDVHLGAVEKLSSGRTVRWMLSGAGYLCRTAGFLYTRLECFQLHVHASSLPLCAGCHGPFCHSHMLSTLHVPGMCYLIFLHVMHTRTAIQLLHRGSFSGHIAGCPSRLSGGPTRSVHANVLPSPVLTRAYSFRISSGRGGIAPPVQRGAAHPRTNPAARAAGGGTAPSESAPGATRPAQVPQLERPRRAPPLSQPHMRGTALPVAACPAAWSQPASGSALVPDALPARAHTLTH